MSTQEKHGDNSWDVGITYDGLQNALEDNDPEAIEYYTGKLTNQVGEESAQQAVDYLNKT